MSRIAPKDNAPASTRSATALSAQQKRLLFRIALLSCVAGLALGSAAGAFLYSLRDRPGGGAPSSAPPASSEAPSSATPLPPPPGAPAYTRLYPDMAVPQPPETQSDDRGVAHITLDDGPSALTPKFLKILRERGVKATFFVVGLFAELHPDTLRDIAEDGHTLAVHSYSHDYKEIYASVESFLDDFYKVWTIIRDETGVTPTLYRFPGGSTAAALAPLRQEIIDEMARRGFQYYDWNVTSGDGSAAATHDSVLSNVESGLSRARRAVILMHDSGGKTATLSAFEEAIDLIEEKGFTLRPLTEADKPVVFKPPA